MRLIKLKKYEYNYIKECRKKINLNHKIYRFVFDMDVANYGPTLLSHCIFHSANTQICVDFL